MSVPHHPGSRPPFGGELQEILRRLDLMERKIDWIARHAVEPGRSDASRAPEDPESHARSEPSPAARPEEPEPEPAKPPERSEPIAVAEPIEPTDVEPVPEDGPVQPESDIPRPVAASRPASIPPAAQRPARAPQTRPRVTVSSTPARTSAPDTRDAHGPSTGAPRPRPPAGPPSAWERIRSEGNVGRYLLSGAAAILVVLSAVSLIALVWDSISDGVKVGSLLLVAAGLVASGASLARRAKRQQVAAATLTGTGGVLGFVAIIGAVLLDTGLPVLPAFGLMTAWAVLLLVTAKMTEQIFTAVIAGLGTLVTIGFAAWHSNAHSDAAILTWSLVCLDVLALAAITAHLARSSESMRLAPWFPATAVPATMAAVLLAPVRILAEASGPLCALMLFMPAVLMGLQVMDAGPRLHRAGWRWVAGVDWGLFGIVVLIAQCRLAVVRTGSGQWDAGALADASAAIAPLLVAAASAALLAKPVSRAWRGQVAPVPLGIGLLVGFVSCVTQMRLFPLVVVALTMSAMPCARLLHSAAVPVVSAFGTMVLLSSIRQPDPASQACALAGLVLLPIGAVVLEQMLKRAPLPQQDEGIPWTSHEQELAARGVSLMWASWVLAADLVFVAPLSLFLALSRLQTANVISALVAGTIAIALMRLGLCSSAPTPVALLIGARAGQRIGAEGEAPTTPMPPAPLCGGYLVLAVIALAQLLVATVTDGLVWQGLLVVVALGAGTTAAWLLWPWLRGTAETIATAGLMSAVVWWSVWILSGERLSSVLLTIVVLATGAVCIIAGFRLRATALRHYGLVLVLVSVLKLAVMDIGNQNSITRVIALGVAGLICFGLSLAYNRIAADGSASGTPSSRPAPDGRSGPDSGAAPRVSSPSTAGYGYVAGSADSGVDDRGFQPPE